VNDYEPIGFFLALAACAGVIAIITRRLDPVLGRLLWIAFALRVIGAGLRYWVLFNVYSGAGDATGYYQIGLAHAARIQSGDLGYLQHTLPGTDFVRVVSGLVLTVIGPSMLGEYVIFAFAALTGLWLTGKAFAQAGGDARAYLLLLAYCPSLWFWPSSIGKEALLLLALGLVVYGYVGRLERVRWSALLGGLALAALVRPHMAALAGLALAIAEALPGARWTLGRVMKLGALGLTALYFIATMGSSFGFDPTEVEQVQAFVQMAANRTVSGGSKIEANSGLSALPLGLMNVFFRPVPWDARSVVQGLASVEVIALWCLAWTRRRRIAVALRTWRDSRALRLAIPCALLFAAAYGLTFFNIGILARQRVTVVALMLMILACGHETAGPAPDEDSVDSGQAEELVIVPPGRSMPWRHA
jgi:hypothetical protein